MNQHQVLSTTQPVGLKEPRPAPKDAGQHALGWPEAIRIALVVLAGVAIHSHLWEPFKPVSLVGVLGIVFGGWPIFKEAGENLSAGRMTMELSMSIAIVTAAEIGEFFTAGYHDVRPGCRGSRKSYGEAWAACDSRLDGSSASFDHRPPRWFRA